MNSEFKIENNNEIILKNRKLLELKGIKKLESLNPSEFYIITGLGDLIVKGENLEMQQLDIDKGNLWISGLVYSLEYVDVPKEKGKTKNIIGKIFK